MNVLFKTIDESREYYTKYVNEHIANVLKAFEMFGDEILAYRDKTFSTGKGFTVAKNIIVDRLSRHDDSKFTVEEFDPYRKNFYCSEEDITLSGMSKEEFEAQVGKEFEEAWRHHYETNNHHPEYWRVNVSGEDKYVTIPTYAFVEMICDWIAVSMTLKSSVSNWWFNTPGGREEKKNQIVLNSDIEFIDEFMRKNESKLDFSL